MNAPRSLQRHYVLASAAVCLFALLYRAQATTPLLSDLPLKSSISIHGITWTLSHAARVGRFVNGDPYVVGACTVSTISPAPTSNPARNGSVLNIPPGDQGTGFDDRSSNYRPQCRAQLPIALKPGDALISTISMAQEAMASARGWLASNAGTASTCKTAGVLTCLATPVALDAFRPSYADRTQKLYYADSIKWHLLPNLPKVSSMTSAKLSEWSQHFMNSPWLDVCFFSFDAPVDYMPHYSAETGRAVGIASLFLVSDFTSAQKDSLMKGFLQYGIDLWGIVRGCNASRGWPAHGGHGTGRKWPMIFSGMLLGDTDMAKPTVTYPNLQIGEDMQTGWDYCWATGDSNYVYMGHQGIWKGEPVSTKPGWGPYEHTPPSQWPRESGYAAPLGETYRRCCTSHSWIAEALGARIMSATTLWNHPAFFGYADRWMNETHFDSLSITTMKTDHGWDFSPKYMRQGASWDAITNDMWKSYRYWNSPVPVQPKQKRPAINKNILKISKLSTTRRSPLIFTFVNNISTVSLDIYDLAGHTIRNLRSGSAKQEGHTIVWDGKNQRGINVSQGCYLFQCTLNGTEYMRMPIIF